MQRPSYWLLSDPAMNRQFARTWVDPPDEDGRKRRPGQTGAADFGKHREDGENTEGWHLDQARAVAEALFAPRRAA